MIRRRRAQDPVQRHRLPVPAALGVRPPDRAGHRPGAGRRAGAGAHRRRPRRDPVLQAARAAGLRGVLLRRPLRRDVGRAAGRRWTRWRAQRHRAAPRSTSCRRSWPRTPTSTPIRLLRGDPTTRSPPSSTRSARPPSDRPQEPAGRRARPGAERAAAGQGRLRDRRRCGRPAARPPRPSRTWCATCRKRSGAAVASAGSRASSACTPGTTATRSATTRSPRPAITPARCTGSATTATCARRPAAAGRRRRAGHPLHRRHHPHAAGLRPVHRSPAQGLRGRARGPAGRDRRGQAGREVLRRAQGRDRGDRASSWTAWGLLPVTAEESLDRRRRPAPPLDGARHLPPPRHRRARLRPGPAGELPGRRAAAGHGDHRRARPVLQVRRPAGAGSCAASASGSRTTS